MRTIYLLSGTKKKRKRNIDSIYFNPISKKRKKERKKKKENKN